MKVKLRNGKEIYLDGYLASVLDTIWYNIKKDWDFVILVTGDRMVRTGKSVLAMNIAAYLADMLNTPYSLDNIFFESQEMIKHAPNFPKYSIIHYDEGREGLAASKSMQSLQKDLLDYFAECGQLNHIFILVMPDFFELKENMAVARSEFLINVHRKEAKIMGNHPRTGERIPVARFDRGYFEFYNRSKKQELFDKSKSTRRKTYRLVKPNFYGKFTNNYTIDEEEYRQAKLTALQRFENRKKEERDAKESAMKREFVLVLNKLGLKAKEIAEHIPYHEAHINKVIAESAKSLGESA